MKRTEQTVRNIFVFDDELAVGSKAQEPSFDVFSEQPQTAPHPLSHLLTTALSFIAARPEISEEDVDALTDYDDLIPLYDAVEDDVEADSISMAVSVIDGIADSLNGADDGVKAPLFLSAFKSRFLA